MDCCGCAVCGIQPSGFIDLGQPSGRRCRRRQSRIAQWVCITRNAILALFNLVTLTFCGPISILFYLFCHFYMVWLFCASILISFYFQDLTHLWNVTFKTIIFFSLSSTIKALISSLLNEILKWIIVNFSSHALSCWSSPGTWWCWCRRRMFPHGRIQTPSWRFQRPRSGCCRLWRKDFHCPLGRSPSLLRGFRHKTCFLSGPVCLSFYFSAWQLKLCISPGPPQEDSHTWAC